MKSKSFRLIRYDADEGKVFDWANLKAHIVKDSDGVEHITHLYAKTLYLGGDDVILNYTEIPEPVQE